MPAPDMVAPEPVAPTPPARKPCPYCRAGWDKSRNEPCRRCDGRGYTAARFRSAVTGEALSADDLTECGRCDGTGGLDRVCPDCGGLGEVEGYGGVLGPGDHVTPRRVEADPAVA